MEEFTVMASLDIEEGLAVKRVRGVRGTGLKLGDPIAVAKQLQSSGAQWLHVVDLDGASTGKPRNLWIVRRLVELGFRVQFGGGIRSVEAALEALRAGASRLVVGSTWISSFKAFLEIVESLGGEKVVAALDESADGSVLYHGWARASKLSVEEALRLLESTGIWGVVYTQTWVEGTLGGVDRRRALRVRRATSLPILYAGGVSSLDDVLWLCRAGFQGVVLGMAVHTGRLRVSEVVENVKEKCS
jgi:phosphoribosylformimino-5-aminoimidazole carboxamide ribotide isomerase